MKNKFGFTLLEILLVVATIGVLAGIIIVAVNPGKQLGAARNATRQADMGSILGALYQYSLDHDNFFPTSTDNTLRMLGTDTAGCAVECGGSGNTSQTTDGTPSTIITDQTKEDFLLGTLASTYYSSLRGALKLTGTSVAGTYTSNIKNSNENTTSWNNLSWKTNQAIQKELPNNGQTETEYALGNANMSENVLLLHLNESAGATTISDSSGNNNSGTCSGSTCPTMGSAGKFKTSGNFSNDYYTINDSASMDVGYGTWSAWIYPTSFNDHVYHTVIAKAYSTAYWFGLYNTSGRIQLWVSGGAVISNTAVPLNQWSLISATWDGSEVKFYINGKPDNTVPKIGQFKTNNVAAHIGADYNTGESGPLAYAFTGKIDEVSVFNRTLSPTEISDHYIRGAGRLKFQARACADETCSSASFVGPDGTANSYFTDPPNSFALSGLNGKYFQYKAFFETDTALFSPELKSISASYKATSAPTETSSTTISSFTAESCLNLTPELIDTYLSSIPFDPQFGSPAKTYYAVQKGSGGRIMMHACGAENGESIIISR